MGVLQELPVHPPQHITFVHVEMHPPERKPHRRVDLEYPEAHEAEQKNNSQELVVTSLQNPAGEISNKILLRWNRKASLSTKRTPIPKVKPGSPTTMMRKKIPPLIFVEVAIRVGGN
jgi:hypothetical protein